MKWLWRTLICSLGLGWRELWTTDFGDGPVTLAVCPHGARWSLDSAGWRRVS